MEEGYFSIEIDKVVIVPNQTPEKDLKLKLTVEIINGYDIFKFTKTNEAKYAGNEFIPIKQPNSNDGPDSLIFGFENLLLRSNFIDLNTEVLNGLANASVIVRIMMLNEANSAAPPAKAAKGVVVEPPPPAEEPLIEVTISLAELLSKQGGILQYDRPLSEYAESAVRCHAMVNTTQSMFNFQAAIDNDLAEYVLGSRLISWNGAQLSNPPHSWSLHAPDVPDPKAKVQPSAADLRTKYLDNITKLIETQSKVCSFTMSIGGNDGDTNPADLTETFPSTGVMDSIRKLFPVLSLADGKIAFDKEKALTLSAEEDIRVRGDLWTVTWASSPFIFLHRNEVRRLIAWITADPQHSFLPLTVRKVPTAEAVAVEGGELFATALLDLSLALEPGRYDFTIDVNLIGEMMMESESQPVSCSVFMKIHGGPLVPIPALQSLKGMQSPIISKKTPKAIISQQPSNRDALQELRDEISSCLERLAQEYVSLYPKPLVEQVEIHNQQSPGAKRDQASLLDEQKTDFVTYLANHGLFHDLQQKLQPKILLIIQERYGPRGRALGKSVVLKAHDTRQQQQQEPQTEEKVSEDRELMQKVLSELYTFLLTECNIVLNSMFTKTIIQKDQQEVENPARIIDTQESEKQRHGRLYREAEDIFAVGDISRAETVHLERLQFLDRSLTLSQDPQLVHDAFVHYAVFLLQSAALLLYRGDAASIDAYQSTMRRAREALTIAAGSLGDVWETSLLQACALLEANQPELGEEVLHKTLAYQLQQDNNHTEYELNSFDDLSGYESDQLCPVHPRCYAVLAAHCQIQQRPLLVRKALLLADRCYEESGESIANHGQPRRTIVLIMAEAAIFLSKHGFGALSSAALALAVDCERAGTVKAQAKGKAALTPPHIRFLLKKAMAMSIWTSSESLDDGEVATQCALVATDSVFDLIDAKVVEGDSFARPTTFQPDRALDAYLIAVQTTMANVDPSIAISKQVIPLRAFVVMGRLLLAAGEFQQATKILLYSLQLYTSPALCLLLGIAYLRVDKLEEAEQALLEANMLDNRNADIWAYLAIVCVARGVHRVPEAEQHLFQALRLDQKDAMILREMALAFMSVDKLQIAEDLMRRTLAVSAARGSNPYHRKLLADILAGQNLAAKAVDEYMEVLQDESLEDVGEKLRAGQKCAELLKTLGRIEEVPALNQIISKLGSAVNADMM